MSKGLKHKTPTQERDALVHRRQEAYAAYNDETKSRQAAERVVGAISSKLRGETLASDGDDLDLEAARTKADYHLKRSNVALDQVRAAEAELDQLYARHFSSFADEADEATEAADTALGDLVKAYDRARVAWDAATLAWAGLCRAHRIQGVPPFPVPDAVIAPIADGEIVARPSAVEILPDEAIITEQTLRD